MKYPEGLGVFWCVCECVSEECGLEIVFFVCVECDVRSLSLTLSFPYGKKFIYQVATYMYLPTYLPTVTECIE